VEKGHEDIFRIVVKPILPSDLAQGRKKQEEPAPEDREKEVPQAKS